MSNFKSDRRRNHFRDGGSNRTSTLVPPALSGCGGRRLLVHVMLIVLISACPGCLPLRLRETPHLTGTVIDAVSHKPLAGVVLYYTDFSKLVKYTTQDGRFDLPPIYRWEFVPVNLDRFGQVSLIIKASEYQPTLRNYHGCGEYCDETIPLKHD